MNIIRASWDRIPSNRPSFEKIVHDLKKQGSEWSFQSPNLSIPDTPKIIPVVDEWDSQNSFHFHHSPNILPRPLPGEAEFDVSQNAASGLGLETGEDEVSSLLSVEELNEVVPLSKLPAEPVVSLSDSTNTMSSNTSFKFEPDLSILASGYLSPPDLNDISTKYRDERRYRMLLQHEYHTIRGYPISILHVYF